MSNEIVVNIFDELVLDDLENFLREKESHLFNIKDLQSARDYMGMSVETKKLMLKDIFENSQDKLAHYNTPKLLRKSFRLIEKEKKKWLRF